MQCSLGRCLSQAQTARKLSGGGCLSSRLGASSAMSAILCAAPPHLQRARSWYPAPPAPPPPHLKRARSWYPAPPAPPPPPPPAPPAPLAAGSEPNFVFVFGPHRHLAPGVLISRPPRRADGAPVASPLLGETHQGAPMVRRSLRRYSGRPTRARRWCAGRFAATRGDSADRFWRFLFCRFL